MEKNTVSFKKGRIPRNQLELPPLHFVVMDQWIELIGEKALFSWLKMYTWCDRDDESVEKNILWEQAKIPTSFRKITKRLGVGNDTFYNKILKPLWNVGLIDLEEYEESENKGTKPMNIIVYKYPRNDINLSHVPLEIVRDYDKDYNSRARTFSKLGGRPKKNEEGKKENDIDNSQSITPDDKGVLSQNRGCSPSEQGGVLPQNRGVFSLGTGGCSEIEHNNIFNLLYNSFNPLNNSLNSFINHLNMLSNSFNSSSKEKEEEEELTINPFTINYLKSDLNYSDYIVNDILKHMRQNGISSFSKAQMLEQYKRINKWVAANNEEIREFGYFFVNGILKHEPSSVLIAQNKKIRKPEDESTNKPVDAQNRPYVPFYNWLEN